MRVVPGVPVEGRAHASRRRLPQRRAAIALVVGVVLVVGGAVTVIAAALQTGSTADLRALDVDGTVSPAPKLPEVDQDTPTASGRPSDVLPGGLVVTAALGRRPRSRSSRPCTGPTVPSFAANRSSTDAHSPCSPRSRTARSRTFGSPSTWPPPGPQRLLPHRAHASRAPVRPARRGPLDDDPTSRATTRRRPARPPPTTMTRGPTETGPGQRPPSIRSSACDPAVHASKSRTSRRIS